MRESFVQCDHCHDRVKEGGVRDNFFHEVTIVMDIGCMGAQSGKRGQLCEDCKNEIVRRIAQFFKGPEAEK